MPIVPSDLIDSLPDAPAATDGAKWRQILIARGVLRPAPLVRHGDPSPEVDRPGPRLRLDDAARRAIRRGAS